jgi:hypothetical protein
LREIKRLEAQKASSLFLFLWESNNQALSKVLRKFEKTLALLRRGIK